MTVNCSSQRPIDKELKYTGEITNPTIIQIEIEKYFHSSREAVSFRKIRIKSKKA
jgi:hypothetical protein